MNNLEAENRVDRLAQPEEPEIHVAARDIVLPVSQSGKMTAKFATCARRNKKNTGNCLCSLRRHKIAATTDCRIGCGHHKQKDGMAVPIHWVRGKNGANHRNCRASALPHILRQIALRGQPS